MARVRVYIAASLDGYIAGPGDDLSFLPSDGGAELATEGAVSFSAFMADVGALLMGRRTYDVVSGFSGPWPYGETPVLVATRRALKPQVPTVQPVVGDIDVLVDRALQAAGGRDVYLDGGTMVQQALAHDRVDELIVTWIPVLLGGGVPLFGALPGHRRLSFEPPVRFGADMVQIRARVVRS